MGYQPDPRIVALDNTKEAALYFPYVLPVNLIQAAPDGGDKSIGMWFKILRSLVPPELRSGEHHHGLADPVTSYVALYLCTHPQILGVQFTEEQYSERVEENMPKLVNGVSELASKGGFTIQQVFLGGDSIDDDGTGEPSVTLSNLKLVDASRIPWEKLIELRRDEAAIQSLKDLRLLLTAEYEGRDIAFVRDHIERRVDKYNETVKGWELDTREGAISMILSSSTALAASTALVASIAVGGPLAAIVTPAAFTTLAMELGSAVLEVRKKKRELHSLRKNDPVAYIVEARKLARPA